jgi:hypothetical protein
MSYVAGVIRQQLDERCLRSPLASAPT